MPPYLEERLAIASGSIQSLGAELEGMGARWQRLEAAAGVLEREIGNATRELSFIRGIEDAPAGATVPGSSPTPRTRPPADRSAIAPAPGTPAPYGRFTVARYNSTVASLKGRRQWLQWGTLGIGAALSAALVALAVLAREPMPATWLAILPAIWMIPVPFFVLSFLGTHRVLRRNHLELSGGA